MFNHVDDDTRPDYLGFLTNWMVSGLKTHDIANYCWNDYQNCQLQSLVLLCAAMGDDRLDLDLLGLERSGGGSAEERQDDLTYSAALA